MRHELYRPKPDRLSIEFAKSASVSVGKILIFQNSMYESRLIADPSRQILVTKASKFLTSEDNRLPAGVASALLQIIGNLGAANSGNTREPLS
jgi:hypothetical protein